MAIKNPDVLIHVIQEMIDQLANWNRRSSVTMDDADELHNHAADILEQTRREVFHLNTIYREDAAAISVKEIEVQAMYQEGKKLKRNSVELHNQAESLQSKAVTLLNRCKQELQKALEWLARAERRLQLAITALKAAEYNLNSAQRSLRSAESALRSCKSNVRKDENGRTIYPNCSSQERAVASAQQQVRNAEKEYDFARAEVNAAQAEVNSARARVAQCEKAVARAEDALNMMPAVFFQAKTCSTFAENVVSNAQAAEHVLGKAKHQNEAQKEKIASVEQSYNKCSKHFGNASGFYAKAQQDAHTSQEYASNGLHDMENRNDFLREFASIPDFPRHS